MRDIVEKIVLDSVETIKKRIAQQLTDSSTPRNSINTNVAGNVGKVGIDRSRTFSNEIGDNAMDNTTGNAIDNAIVDAEISSRIAEPTKIDVANSGSIGLINAHSRNRRMNIMILGAVFGLIFCLLMLVSYKGDLPGEVVGIVSTISGIFGACLKDAYSFEFGSSRGSKEKDEKISAAILDGLKR
jgi:hypothetical protein